MPQDDLGPLQGIDHVGILAPVTRQSRTLRVADQIARDLDKAWAIAEGDGGPPGPVYIEIPTDVLRQTVPRCLRARRAHGAEVASARCRPMRRWWRRPPTRLRAARRPLVVTGRGARGAGAALTRLLDASGALYLDTQESRGLVDGGTRRRWSARCARRAMQEADLVLVVGRKLDYQMGYGSPAVFKQARFIRIADHAEELRDNRRGEVELLADAGLTLAALADALGQPSAALDTAWTGALRAEHVKRARQVRGIDGPGAGRDATATCTRTASSPRCARCSRPMPITIADGGDLLSFARMGLESRHYLDAGAFGCLGVGTPYAVAAALLHPERQVVAITGDGAFGINAMEIDSAQAPRRQGGVHRLQQRGLEHRAARPGDELRRPCRRHHAGVERLCRHGARLRPACRARHRPGAPAGRASRTRWPTRRR